MNIQDYKPLELADIGALQPLLRDARPRVSELSFTNLFMWRGHYRPRWAMIQGCLQIIMDPIGGAPFAMQPVGPGDKAAAMAQALEALARAGHEPVIRRADAAFVQAFAAGPAYQARPDRDQFDYVYLAEDLINLAGRRYHRKKNHYNQFVKSAPHQYKPLDMELVEQVLEMQEHWCQMRECGGDPSLINEDVAIKEALSNFDKLDYVGGAICVQGRVEAFSLGEMLNDDTAVIHIEKANPDLPGLYAVINRDFAAAAFGQVKYVNREQDLGLEGLRAAKESYRPALMIEKFDVRPA